MTLAGTRPPLISETNLYDSDKPTKRIIKILIIKDLNNGKIVLFSGTPCQVAAVKCLCKGKSNYENLITLEILCYGVPTNHFGLRYS